MNTGEDRRRAGIFLLTAVSLILVVAVILAGVRLMTRENHYIVEFRGESVGGLEVSGPVKYNGVPVGKVESISLNPEDIEKIHVEIAVTPGVPIKLDTRARLAMQGITGILYLELSGGRIGSPDLEERDIIPGDPSLATRVGGIATDLSELIATLNRLIKANEDNITRIIEQFAASADAVRTTLLKVDETVGKAGLAVDEARGGIADVRAEVKASSEALRKVLADLDAMLTDPTLRSLPVKVSLAVDHLDEKIAAADTARLTERLDQVLSRFLEVQDSVDRAARSVASLAGRGEQDVAAMLADMRAASANVKALTRSLRDDPSLILKGRVTDGRPIPDPHTPLPEDRR